MTHNHLKSPQLHTASPQLVQRHLRTPHIQPPPGPIHTGAIAKLDSITAHANIFSSGQKPAPTTQHESHLYSGGPQDATPSTPQAHGGGPLPSITIVSSIADTPSPRREGPQPPSRGHLYGGGPQPT